jgi:hypothetical protein
MRYRQRPTLSRNMLRAAYSAPAQVVSDLGRWAKMKKILFIIFLALGLTGCIPLQQTKITGGQNNDYFGYYDDYGLLNIGTWNETKAIHILAVDSYAIGAGNEKYGIRSEPHQYDIDKNYPYIRDRIYVIDKNGKQLGRLKSGKWKFVFNFETQDGKDSRTFDASVSTFYYTPIIHGPPN